MVGLGVDCWVLNCNSLQKTVRHWLCTPILVWRGSLSLLKLARQNLVIADGQSWKITDTIFGLNRAKIIRILFYNIRLLHCNNVTLLHYYLKIIMFSPNIKALRLYYLRWFPFWIPYCTYSLLFIYYVYINMHTSIYRQIFFTKMRSYSFSFVTCLFQLMIFNSPWK